MEVVREYVFTVEPHLYRLISDCSDCTDSNGQFFIE